MQTPDSIIDLYFRTSALRRADNDNFIVDTVFQLLYVGNQSDGKVRVFQFVSCIVVHLVESFEVTRFAVTTVKLRAHIVKRDVLVHHHDGEVIEKVADFAHGVLFFAVFRGDDDFAALFAALFEDLIKPPARRDSRCRSPPAFRPCAPKRYHKAAAKCP